MRQPDYQREGISLYLGDCLEILPELGEGVVDLVLTDPPYPYLKGGVKVNFTSGAGECRVVNKTLGTPWGDDLSGLSLASQKTRLGILAFCSFHSVASIPSIVGLEPCALVSWYQRNAMPPINNVPHFQTEFVWAFRKAPGLNWKALKTMYDIPRLQAGCMASERICTRTGEVAHPAQKPIALIQDLLAIGGESVLDCYMGTGTTGVACIRLGRRFIGIEREPRYFKIAVERIEAELNQGDLFREVQHA